MQESLMTLITCTHIYNFAEIHKTLKNEVFSTFTIALILNIQGDVS